MEEDDQTDMSATIAKFGKPKLKNILKVMATLGISGGKIFLWIILTFCFVNFILLIYGFVRFFAVDLSWTNLTVVLFLIVLALVFTCLAVYLTYRYVLKLTVQKVYALTLDQRTKICTDVVRQAEITFTTKKEISQKQLAQAVDWSKTVYRYYHAVPVFFRSGITQYLNRIPITNYLIDLKEDILSGNQSVAAEKLRTAADTFFEEHIIGSPNNIWSWLLLLVDFLVLYGVIIWGIF